MWNLISYNEIANHSKRVIYLLLWDGKLHVWEAKGCQTHLLGSSDLPRFNSLPYHPHLRPFFVLFWLFALYLSFFCACFSTKIGYCWRALERLKSSQVQENCQPEVDRRQHLQLRDRRLLWEATSHRVTELWWCGSDPDGQEYQDRQVGRAGALLLQHARVG